MGKVSIQTDTQASNPVFTEEDLSSSPNILNYASFTIRDLFYWWYIQMPIYYVKKLDRISTVISDQLSILILLRHFFLPWKRHKAAVGYFIGITIKLLYLPIAITLYLVGMAICISLFLFWLLIPPVAVLMTLISLFL